MGDMESLQKVYCLAPGKGSRYQRRRHFRIKENDYFCYVLTDELAPWQVHKQYGQRATSETWIEEAKNQSALAHIKTADFWGNSALFQTAILVQCSALDGTLQWK